MNVDMKPGNRFEQYRFVLQPKWIIGHLIIIATVISFINFGLWQFRRLDEKRTRNSQIEQRLKSPVESLDSLIEPTVEVDDPKVDSLIYRRVRVVGRYDEGGEVLVRSRSLNGQAGYHVLTPLIVGKDLGVLVNRGWVPGPDVTRSAQSGTVEVTGIILATQRRGSIGPTDPPKGKLTEIARSDIERVQLQYGPDLYPVIVQLIPTKTSTATDIPVVLGIPPQDEGNHLSYALQWMCFSAIAVIGWGALIRRTAKTTQPPEQENDN